MNSPWHEIRREVGRRRGVSGTPSLRRWQLRGDRGLEERQALVEDPEFPAEFGKAGRLPWKKAGDTYTSQELQKIPGPQEIPGSAL